MPRKVILPNTDLSEQHALNAIATGVAGMRTTDVFVNDAKGTTLALSSTNSSKAIPASVRVVTFWCATDFRFRLNTVADLVDGAYGKANDVISVTIDPDDTSPVTTLQALLAAGNDTLYITFAFGT